MKTIVLRLSALLLIVIMCGGAALAWAPGTHTFIASQLKPTTPGYINQQRYGAVAADVDEFFTAAPDYLTGIFPATHYMPMQVWNTAQGMSITDRALAYGWVSHNEDWGADHNAHIGSFLFGPNKGYVIKKAGVLCGTLRTQLHLAGMDAYLPIITDMNCHFIVEYGMDILMTYRDPQLGMKVLTAAMTQKQQIDLLLVLAFPIPLTADMTLGEMFAGAESMSNGWNDIMQQYGMVLMAPVGQRVPVMSQFLTQLAMGMGILPATSDPAQLAAMQKLIELALVDSMVICAPDLQIEVNATARRVALAMKAHGVNY